MSHKFQIRQRVRLSKLGFSDKRINSTEVYEVIRLLPADQTGEPAYRIKASGNERAVLESEITLAS
ncbi:MAG TPA: hypothetical protein VMU56_06825 [Beijerinckiaceae bacterium]|nr:hypothetical protein [Beijerinckiaceae bacterium]